MGVFETISSFVVAILFFLYLLFNLANAGPSTTCGEGFDENKDPRGTWVPPHPGYWYLPPRRP